MFALSFALFGSFARTLWYWEAIIFIGYFRVNLTHTHLLYRRSCTWVSETRKEPRHMERMRRRKKRTTVSAVNTLNMEDMREKTDWKYWLNAIDHMVLDNNKMSRVDATQASHTAERMREWDGRTLFTSDTKKRVNRSWMRHVCCCCCCLSA